MGSAGEDGHEDGQMDRRAFCLWGTVLISAASGTCCIRARKKGQSLLHFSPLTEYLNTQTGGLSWWSSTDKTHGTCPFCRKWIYFGIIPICQHGGGEVFFCSQPLGSLSAGWIYVQPSSVKTFHIKSTDFSESKCGSYLHLVHHVKEMSRLETDRETEMCVKE